jgi:type II secretory pathway component PulC
MASYRLLPIAIGVLASACGGASTAPPATAAGEGERVVYAPPTVTGAIRRADLLPVLDAGLGRFLQGVETEPALADGRFVGFRLVALYPSDPRFQDIGLGPGDVVTRVNGQSIERPEGAFQVWDGLRVASQLLIEYVRGDERRELRFDIVD